MFRWIVLIVFISVLTVFLCLYNPVLHKSIVITDTGMKVVDEPVKKTDNVQVNTVQYQPPQSEIKVQPKQVTQPVKTVSPKTSVSSKTVTKTIQQKPKTAKNVTQKTQPKPKTTKTVPKTVKPVQQKAVPPKPKTTTKQISKTPLNTTKSVATPQKVLTQQEETILWNKWHSNLQNRIISEATSRLKKLDSATKQSINGTLYIMYTFTVSKNGTISNISVKTNISNEASQQVKSIVTNIISGYRGSSVLVFPKGTTRTSEQHRGAISTVIKNANSTTYSNTNDYNKYNETVKR